MKMKISDELCDRIISAASNRGFIGMGWAVTDEKGRPFASGAPLEPGMFVAAENYYGYVVLRVNADMSLTECERED